MAAKVKQEETPDNGAVVEVSDFLEAPASTQPISASGRRDGERVILSLPGIGPERVKAASGELWPIPQGFEVIGRAEFAEALVYDADAVLWRVFTDGTEIVFIRL